MNRTKNLNVLDWIVLILIIIGGLNWGLIGFFGYNLIDAIFGLTIARIIYVLVGLATIYLLIISSKLHKREIIAARV
ncbi:MAG: DUF378 domain-containing protein [Candidatus Portnoybacteria bacterium]|nr:DUF378 domain-containing protein [Candidatus Portnoybacteria bacterium]